jgi:hypothetical protein
VSRTAFAFNLAVAVALAALAYFATGAVFAPPWPAIAAAAVFVLYWVGVAVIIIDFDWFD